MPSMMMDDSSDDEDISQLEDIALEAQRIRYYFRQISRFFLEFAIFFISAEMASRPSPLVV